MYKCVQVVWLRVGEAALARPRLTLTVCLLLVLLAVQGGAAALDCTDCVQPMDEKTIISGPDHPVED